MSENVVTDLGLELKVGRHWALPSQMQGEAAGKHWGACRPALMMAREQLRVGRYRKCATEKIAAQAFLIGGL